MVQYLRQLLANSEAFTVTARTNSDYYYSKRGLVAVDEVGIVLEGPIVLPWSNILYLDIKFQ